MARLTYESVAAGLVKFRGNISAVAESHAVTRRAVYNYIERHPKLGHVLKDARESMADAVKSRFFLDCLKDLPAYQTSRIFFLKTQCGWAETHRITGADGGPVELELVEKIIDAPQTDNRASPRAE